MIPRSSQIRLLVLGIACVAMLAVRFLWGDATALAAVVEATGYYAAVALALCTAAFLVRGGRQVLWRQRWREDRGPLLIMLLLTGWLHLHTTHDYKVLFDEYALAATAWHMHHDRKASVPLSMHTINGAPQVTSSDIGKRPFYFPFLTSVLHDLTGYRTANPLILNALLTVLVMVLLYHLVRLRAGPAYGLLAAFLLAGFPLVGQVGTSAGVGMLNLAGMLAFMLAAVAYARDGHRDQLDLLIAFALLLAFTRYESVLFTVPLALLTLWTWIRRRRVELSWFAACSPLFLFYPLAINANFMANRSFMQLGFTDRSEAFSLDFLTDNLGHAATFFFSGADLYLSNPVLALAGTVAVIFLLVHGLSCWAGRDGAACWYFPVALSGLLLAALLFLLMTYHWGHLTDQAVSRLALPTMLLMAVAMPVVLAHVRKQRRLPTWALGIAAGFVLLTTTPVLTKDRAYGEMAPARSVRFILDKIARLEPERSLFLGPSTLPFIVHGYAATPVDHANNRPAALKALLELGLYENIYVFDRSFLRLDTMEMERARHKTLGSAYELETIARARLLLSWQVTLSRVVSIEVDPERDLPAVLPLPGAPEGPPFQSSAELRDYLLRLYP